MPFEFPAVSCGESDMRPTAMPFRNLTSMGVEESICANPVDGVVLMAGYKTTPFLLIGAASCNLPAIVISGSPMLNGSR